LGFELTVQAHTAPAYLIPNRLVGSFDRKTKTSKFLPPVRAVPGITCDSTITVDG
jgi:hypothetical protein